MTCACACEHVSCGALLGTRGLEGGGGGGGGGNRRIALQCPAELVVTSCQHDEEHLVFSDKHFLPTCVTRMTPEFCHDVLKTKKDKEEG